MQKTRLKENAPTLTRSIHRKPNSFTEASRVYRFLMSILMQSFEGGGSNRGGLQWIEPIARISVMGTRAAATALEEDDAHSLRVDESIPPQGSSDAAHFPGDSA